MKKVLVTVLALLGLAGPIAAQDATTPRSAPNAVYFELLGNGLIYSLNYDRMFTEHFGARVGFSGLGAADDSSSAAVVAAPIMATYLSGGGNHHFEAGLGVMLASGAVEGVEDFEDEEFSGAVGTATLGYRYQRPGGGFVFRTGVTPYFGTGGVLPWFGVSFGYGF